MFVLFYVYILVEYLFDGYVYLIEWYFVYEKLDGIMFVMSVWMEIDNINNVEFKDLLIYFLEVFVDFEIEWEIILDVNEFMLEECVFYMY